MTRDDTDSGAAPVAADEHSLAMDPGDSHAKAPRASRGRAATPPDPVRSFLQSVTDPVVAFDRSWRYVYVNKAAERWKGRTASDLLGRRVWDEFPDVLQAGMRERYESVIESGQPASFDEFYFPLGVWYEVRVYPSADSLWAWFRNITSRKVEERAIARSEEQYRMLFERSPAALYRTAVDGRLLDVNPALVRLLGYPDRETLMRVNAGDVYLDSADRRRWQMLLDAQESGVFEMHDCRYDGSVIWVRDVASAIRDEAGSVLFYEGVLEDITELKEAEEAAREGDERFRLLALASDNVIWDWDITTGRVVWNAALRRVFGHDPARVGPGIEHSYAWWTSHIHPQDRERVAAELHRAVGSGAVSLTQEYRFRHLDGRYSRVLDRTCIGRDHDGSPTRLLGLLVDVSQRPRRVSSAPASIRKPPVPSTSDATLIRWIGQADERALDELYVRHASTLFTVALSLGVAAEDGEELVADVFLRVWKEASSFVPERGSVTAWLSAMCKSRALDLLRLKSRRSRLLRETADEPEPTRPEVLGTITTTNTADELSDRLLVEASLACLPEPQRQVLELAYFCGLTHAEIAARLDEPLGTVKTRIRAGLARMRRLVEQPS